MTVITNNSITGINSITAQASTLNFYDSTGNQLKLSAEVNPGTGTSISSPATNVLTLGTNDNERLRVDSSGNIGIGTASPGVTLDAVGSIRSATASDSRFLLRVNEVNKGGFSATTDDGVVIYGASSSNPIRFQTSGQERARIDTSGNLGLNTTSPSTYNDAGTGGVNFVLGSSGSGRGVLTFASEQTSGENEPLGIINFTDTGTTNAATRGARILAFRGPDANSNYLVFQTCISGDPATHMTIERNGNVFFSNVPNAVYPATDNAVGLGANGVRWNAVWAANGTIQTSDERAKTDIADAQLGSDFIKSLRPVSYRWIEGGKRDTGERDEDGNYIYESTPGTRTHWGFIAQEVKQAVDDAGVDFAGWVLTDKDDPDSEQALRYDQFIAPLTKALQEALTKIETLETQNAAILARLDAAGI